MRKFLMATLGTGLMLTAAMATAQTTPSTPMQGGNSSAQTMPGQAMPGQPMPGASGTDSTQPAAMPDQGAGGSGGSSTDNSGMAGAMKSYPRCSATVHDQCRQRRM